MAETYRIKKRRGLFDFNITFLLIAINVICFIAFSILTFINPNSLNYIALNPANIINNLYIWTFLTSMFMHAGFFHIFANMLSLLFIGNFIEKILGRKRYFTFYILAGLFAGIVFILSELVIKSGLPAVGASGAIFGLVGLLMILTPNLPVYVMFVPIPIKMKYAAPAMLVLLWIVSLMGNIPVGNTAHLGGFIIGLAYGFYLKKKYKNKTKYISQYFK